MTNILYYNVTIEEAAEDLETNIHSGLENEEAKSRLKKYGLNLLMERGGISPLQAIQEYFKEKQEMTIHFPDFSSEVIRIFADFIYLGPDGLLKEEALHPKFSQTVELFKLGHLYQIPFLVEFCTFLFQRQVTEKDVAMIKELAETYESPQLHSICSKLGLFQKAE